MQNQTGGQALTVNVDPDGTVCIPAHAVPLSIYMSDEAKQIYAHSVLHPPAISFMTDIATTRKSIDRVVLQPQLDKAKAAYPVTIEDQTIAGVRVTVVTPKEGIAEKNRNRVLINLHGGGFTLGSGVLQLVESIPIAATAQIKVISIDYRLTPEHRFPAASEDVAAVYRFLLERYKAENIGIYGSSSGGTLVGMSLAWFQKEKLPTPGAIGIFSPADVVSGGDSRFLATALHPPFGARPAPPPAVPNPPAPPIAPEYIVGADLTSSLLMPTSHPQVIGRFPPTLLVTGTRDMFASSVFHLHRKLCKARVVAELHVWEGMWHGFVQYVDFPESRDMYDVTADFFDRHLGCSAADAIRQTGVHDGGCDGR